MSPDEPTFETFFREAEPRLRRSLVAAFGAEAGREAATDALSYGWEHWERIRTMENPIGYLYRVGHRRAKRALWWRSRRPLFPAAPEGVEPWVEPDLLGALEELTWRQRQAVVLVVGCGYPYREVARLLGVAPSTVQTHVERALAALRNALGVTRDA